MAKKKPVTENIGNDRDKLGRFAPGNQVKKGSPEVRLIMRKRKEDIAVYFDQVFRPRSSLIAENKDPNVCAVKYVINQAFLESNTKLIIWITEMILGRPKEEEQINDNVFVATTKEQQDKLVKMAMEARKEKEREEKRKGQRD